MSEQNGTEHLSLMPEIDALRSLLRRIGADTPEEREAAAAESKGVARIVSALVSCIRIENQLHPSDDAGVEHSLGAIIQRAMMIAGEGKPRA